jgi:hypothetical protein
MIDRTVHAFRKATFSRYSGMFYRSSRSINNVIKKDCELDLALERGHCDSANEFRVHGHARDLAGRRPLWGSTRESAIGLGISEPLGRSVQRAHSRSAVSAGNRFNAKQTAVILGRHPCMHMRQSAQNCAP